MTIQYRSLLDAGEATEDLRYGTGRTQIWYATRESFRALSLGPDFARKRGIAVPSDPQDLLDTHVRLGVVDETRLESIFVMMQGEVWSPNGEANSLIRSRGLGHTSMSVGDVVVLPSGKMFMVDMHGFTALSDGSPERKAVLAGLQGLLSKTAFGDFNIPDKHIFDNAQVRESAKVFDNAKVSWNAKMYDNAKLYDRAEVYDDAKVSENAEVYGRARVSGYAEVFGNAKVYGNALVTNNAKVRDNAKVFGNAEVYDNAKVSDNAKVYDDARVSVNAKVYHDAQVYDGALVYGLAVVLRNAHVYGNAEVGGNAIVGGDARIGGTAIILGGVWDGSEGEVLSGKWRGPGVPA